ncbi:MAG: ECF transporter S component [Candidatus Bathyarchaeia archaeon]
MKVKEIALVSVLSAATIVIAYARGLAIPSLPGVVEFMTVIIFVSGFSFGWLVGALLGAVALTLYMLVPFPFAHPAAWLFIISPVLLAVMACLGSLYGVVGGILGRRWKSGNSNKIGLRFVLEMAFWGFILTFTYDILSSVGFFLAYPVYPSVWDAIYLTFIPLYYPYPPIIHTLTNTIVFAIVAPPLIKAIRAL